MYPSGSYSYEELEASGTLAALERPVSPTKTTAEEEVIDGNDDDSGLSGNAAAADATSFAPAFGPVSRTALARSRSTRSAVKAEVNPLPTCLEGEGARSDDSDASEEIQGKEEEKKTDKHDLKASDDRDGRGRGDASGGKKKDAFSFQPERRINRIGANVVRGSSFSVRSQRTSQPPLMRRRSIASMSIAAAGSGRGDPYGRKREELSSFRPDRVIDGVAVDFVRGTSFSFRSQRMSERSLVRQRSTASMAAVTESEKDCEESVVEVGEAEVRPELIEPEDQEVRCGLPRERGGVAGGGGDGGDKRWCLGGETLFRMMWRHF